MHLKNCITNYAVIYLVVFSFFTLGISIKEACLKRLSGRVDRKVLKWFEHFDRMGSERMTKRVYLSEVEG